MNAALDIARRYAFGGRANGYSHGGHVHQASVAGPIVGTDGGRADTKPVSVKSGSFVVSADVVAALGEGNNNAGQAKLDKVFGGSEAHRRYAAGGSTAQDTPIMISDGEYVIPPEAVAHVGKGDMAAGHRALDALMIKLRKENVATLRKLPPPARG